jgi:hypothetical protein
MKRFLVAATLASAVFVAALAGCSSSSSAARKDVTITACTSSPNGAHPTASGRIVNHSSKSSLYTIHVKFTDASGNGVGDGLAAVAKVDPGTTANWHATGSLAAKGKLECSLANVTRNVS